MRDSYVIYRSFIEGLEELNDESYIRLHKAIDWYGIDGREPNLTGIEMSLFKAWKANVDANNKRSDISKDTGKLGGRPKKTQGKNPPFSDENPPFSEKNPPFSDENLNENENENENENVNDNETETDKAAPTREEKHKYGTYKHVLLTKAETEKLMEEYGADKAVAAVQYLDEYIERKGYKTKSHYLAIRKWVFDAMKEEEIKKQEIARREQRLAQPTKQESKAGVTRGQDLDAMLLEKTRQQVLDKQREQRNLEWLAKYRKDSG